jgi:hypothetical protein
MMRSAAAIVVELEQVMEREERLIEQFSSWERSMNERVKEKQWKELQQVMVGADEVSKSIDECEKLRAELFEQLRKAVGEAPDSGFYQVAVRLPEKDRNRLSERFRSLKMSVLKLRGIIWGIDAYVKAVQGALKDIIGEISPARKGTIYAKTGTARNAETGALVLNRHL